MKLVNVEDLKVLVAVESKGEIRYGKLVTDLFDDIPTVKAIPIEWINKWGEKFYKVINDRGHYMGDGYDSVWDMLEDWEKENGQETTN